MASRIFLFLFLLLFFHQGHAASWLAVKEDLSVYKKPKITSQEVHLLESGDVILVSDKKYGNFYKVRYYKGKKKRSGYINKDDIFESYFTQSKKRVQKLRREKSKSNYQLGVSLFSSYLAQGKRTIMNSSGETNEAGTFSSFTNFLSIFGELPLANKNVIRVNLNLRETKFSGELVNKDSPSPNSKAQLSQSLLGIGAIYKWMRPSSVWYGLGAELAKGQSVTLKIDNAPVTTTKEDLPFFGILTAHVGWNFSFFGNRILFSPELRAGLIANTNPITVVAEGTLSLGGTW